MFLVIVSCFAMDENVICNTFSISQAPQTLLDILIECLKGLVMTKIQTFKSMETFVSLKYAIFLDALLALSALIVPMVHIKFCKPRGA